MRLFYYTLLTLLVFVLVATIFAGSWIVVIFAGIILLGFLRTGPGVVERGED